MGARPDRPQGALVCCRLLLLSFVLLLCACLLMAMVATDAASLGPNAAGTSADMTTGSPAARHSGGTAGSADALFRSSKRRIPKGPDPIHNRRAGKTTIAPRRRD